MNEDHNNSSLNNNIDLSSTIVNNPKKEEVKMEEARDLEKSEGKKVTVSKKANPKKGGTKMSKTTKFNPRKGTYKSVTALVRAYIGDPSRVKGKSNLDIHDALVELAKDILPGTRFQPSHVAWHIGNARKKGLPCAVPMGRVGDSSDPKNREDLDKLMKERLAKK